MYSIEYWCDIELNRSATVMVGDNPDGTLDSLQKDMFRAGFSRLLLSFLQKSFRLKISQFSKSDSSSLPFFLSFWSLQPPVQVITWQNNSQNGRKNRLIKFVRKLFNNHSLFGPVWVRSRISYVLQPRIREKRQFMMGSQSPFSITVDYDDL